MTSRSDSIVGRARALIGTPYRPQGRTPEGVDCVGLAALALALPAAAVPRPYGRRSAGLDLLSAQLPKHGFASVAEEAALAGDLIVFAAGLGQLHLAIATGAGFVHADARLRRVAERPLPAPWPIAAIFRSAEPQELEPQPWPHSS